MRLRICDDGRERIAPATAELVDGALAPDAPVSDGLEITLAEGDRWLTVIAVGGPGEPDEFLISDDGGNRSGRVSRSQAHRMFREFFGEREEP